MVGNKKKASKGGGKDKGRPSASVRKRSGSTRRPGLTLDKYNIMLASYTKHRSVNQAARDAGVSHRTAKRYIDEGFPNHGMPAIHDVVMRADQKVAEHESLTLAKFRARYLESVMEAMGTSEIELKLHRVWAQKKAVSVQKGDLFLRDSNGEIMKNDEGDPIIVTPSLPFKAQVQAHDTLARLGERALGAADETIADAKEENILAQLTREEKLDYIRTAKLPERFRK